VLEGEKGVQGTRLDQVWLEGILNNEPHGHEYQINASIQTT